MTPSDEAIALDRSYKLYQLSIGTEHEEAALELHRRTVDSIRRSQIAAGLHARSVQP